jgi:regulator of protease activity HflC (stomatin/prohibitin superfamily)
MKIFPKRFEVNPNQTGFLFRNKKLQKVLEPGIYRFWDPVNRINFISLPLTERLFVVTNQEVLTKDHVALRFSFVVSYKIVDGTRFLRMFQLENQAFPMLGQAEQVISTLFQIRARRLIAQVESEVLHEKRNEVENLKSEETEQELKSYGIEAIKAEIRDITFPKNIQDLFTRQLESKTRAKADLENARTTVATARALKNAAELMKGDDSIRFLQYLDTLSKISSKGKHTFMIGEIPRMSKDT